MEQFIDWLRKEIRVRGISSADLARDSGLSPSTISRILGEHVTPGDDALSKIAKALGEPPEKIFRLAGRLPPAPETEGVEQDLLHGFRSLPAAYQQAILAMIRGASGVPAPPRTTAPSIPDLDEPSPTLEDVWDIVQGFDEYSRRQLYDFARWQKYEQESRHNSSGERSRTSEAKKEEWRRAIEHIDLYLAVDEADPEMVQRVIGRLQKILNEQQRKEVP
jgi:transcriptional regulator with XRE-family HTH domain